MSSDLKIITWVLLIIAIVLEASGTISMKFSEGFTKLVPVIAMLIFYALGLSLLALTLRTINLSVAYAVWSGLGTAIVAIFGMLWFKEPVNAIKIISLILIVVGVVGLSLGGSEH